MTFWKKGTLSLNSHYFFFLKGFLFQINSLVQILRGSSLKDHLAVYPETIFMTMEINLSDEYIIVLKLKGAQSFENFFLSMSIYFFSF